ncbi:F-box/kelch-repeat protein At3g06240-like [Rhododendron vialii]|uniref:F-box/kelch-repeat protein At3g06240-like n=1 Tax=Rhododendron vialii TaxID=182163 RepID=UPI00265E1CE3|nr:F-box/kelch-repeat protein At3g06240-like [Rhododendron vialii]
MYGFGYDESIDDYKVVGFFRNLNSSLEVEVQVCTLRTHSWRRIGIGSFPLCLPSDGLVANLNGIFVSGALHWFLGGSRSRIIVSLDLAKETHGEVMEPHYQRGTSLYKIRFRLDVLNGCLCILATYYDCTDVWVMKEYGIRESWAKLVTITYAAHPFDGYLYSQPLCILANGEILLDIQWQLALYNCKDGTFSYPMIQIFSSFSVHTYVESLVSPDTDVDSGV